MIDVMTSSHFYGDNTGAYIELQRIATHLKDFGFNVVREKIETIPYHPAAPTTSDKNPTMPENCYFESHISVYCDTNSAGNHTKEKLSELAKKHGAHISRNFLKKAVDGRMINMITLRDYKSPYGLFKNDLGALKESLSRDGFQFEKEIVEFSIYDTKVSHDFKWTNALKQTELV